MKKFFLFLNLTILCLQINAQKFLPEVDKIHKDVFKEYLSEAKKGNAESQYIVGMNFLRGKFMEVDYKQAEKWLKQAEKQGYVDAYEELANLYDELSRSVLIANAESKEYKDQAVYYYKKSISENLDREKRCLLADDMIFLEYDFLEKSGLDFKSLDETNAAIKLFIDGSDLGSVNASFMLGCYYRYNGIKDKSVFYFTRAADNGDYDSQEILGLAYFSGDNIVARDYDKAFKYLKLACTNPDEEAFEESNDSPEAMNKLASCYRYGRGTKVNEKIANLWDYICAFAYGNNVERIKEIEGIDFDVDIYEDYSKFEKSSVFLMSKLQDVLREASFKDNGCKIIYHFIKANSLQSIEEYGEWLNEMKNMTTDENFSNIEKALTCSMLSALLSQIKEQYGTNLYEQLLSDLGSKSISDYDDMIIDLGFSDEEINLYIVQRYKVALLPY